MRAIDIEHVVYAGREAAVHVTRFELTADVARDRGRSRRRNPAGGRGRPVRLHVDLVIVARDVDQRAVDALRGKRGIGRLLHGLPGRERRDGYHDDLLVGLGVKRVQTRRDLRDRGCREHSGAVLHERGCGPSRGCGEAGRSGERDRAEQTIHG